MKLKNLLYYGGVDKKTFHLIQDDIIEGNRKNIMSISLLVAIVLFGMELYSLIWTSIARNRMAYAICLGFSLILYFVAKYIGKNNKRSVMYCVYAFLCLIMAFGITLGTFIEPNEMTTSFLVALIVCPLLFTDSPLRMIFLILLSIFVYYICAFQTQTPTYIMQNTANMIPYGALSVCVSTLMMIIKIERLVLVEENRLLSEQDQLTGLENRRCYEQHLEKIRNKGVDPQTLVCALDVNGLKTVNDNLGHHAGDELIQGAANCISNTFASYGKCYRTGGDEFMVILEGYAPTKEEFSQILAKQCSCWKGNLVSGMSISLGFANYSSGKNIDEIVQAADKDMYAYKANYYKQTGLDRRKR